MAPLQGYTSVYYRSAYNSVYGGADKYFTPFFEYSNNRDLSPNLLSELNEDLNGNMKLIPQLLTNSHKDLLHFCEIIGGLGYQEVNLNLGCPHPPVVNKKLGGGLLNHPDLVDQILQGFFSKNTIQKLSIKMRLGIDDESDWIRIINVINQYPVHEVIVHPRTVKQQYKGIPKWDLFDQLQNRTSVKIIGNGDINSALDMLSLTERFPKNDTWMLGRGLLKSPWLINELSGKNTTVRRNQLKQFHLFYWELINHCEKDINIKRNLAIGFWNYLSESMHNGKRLFRQLMKDKKMVNYFPLSNELLNLPFIDE